MKVAFLGAGGARTPLVIQSILAYRQRVPISQICMMDIDGERLDLMRTACKPWLADSSSLPVEWTTDPQLAIRGSDFIVTTFRAGLMASRVIDEQVPLKYGVIGQETTGPGGFAMALRTIPVMLDYVRLIEKLAPEAWIFNFSNPAGIMTEAITRLSGFERVVGICDNPGAMLRAAAAYLSVPTSQLFPEYFGLNHLGWLRGLYLNGVDQVPRLIRAVVENNINMAGLPFEPALLSALGAIPNEYNYFYYYPQKSVDNILKSGQSRAQQILPFNESLYANLRRIRDEEADPAEVEEVYSHYLEQRHSTYMTIETGGSAHESKDNSDEEWAATPNGSNDSISHAAEGYTGVTLDLLEAVVGKRGASAIILNVPNRGALPGMAGDDVVEVTCFAGNGVIRPLAMGPLPEQPLALMKQVKAFERLTIQAAAAASYKLSVEALALHPLVPSHDIATAIVNDYVDQHGDYFPTLS